MEEVFSSIILADLLCKKCKISSLESDIWAWKINNVYPEELRKIIYTWVEKDVVDTLIYAEISIKQVLDNCIMDGKEKDFLNACELMYILSINKSEGRKIYIKALKKDRRK